MSVLTLYIVLNLSKIDLISLNILILETTFFVFIFALLSILLISLRLYLLINNFFNIHFKKILIFSLVSYVFNVLSFSGSGELLKYYFINKETKTKSEIISIFILEKLISLVSILIIISLAFMTAHDHFYVSFFFLILVLIIIFFKNNFFISKLPYLNYLNYSLSLIVKNKKILKVLLLSLLTHIVFIVQFYTLTIIVFQIDINLKDLFYISALIMFLNALPFTFSGFGARELAVMISSYFILFDFKKFIDVTLSLGISNLLASVIIFLLICFYLFMIRKLRLFDFFKLRKIAKLIS